MTDQGVTQGGERDVDGAGVASGFHYPGEAMPMPWGAMKGKAVTLQDYWYAPLDGSQLLRTQRPPSMKGIDNGVKYHRHEGRTAFD